MSSWFGSGLSQITGQISNFTKEVIEEGTGEIDDPGTQLKIARRHLVELDANNQIQRAEVERLKLTNHEVQEKLESSELQINAISNEYRDIVEAKEKEIKQLKLTQNELYMLPTPSLELSCSKSPPGSGMSHCASAPSLHAGFHGDEEDFSDIITAQHEINRLRGENQRLEGECRHWKQLVETKNVHGNGQDSDLVQDLQTQLKEIQEKYDYEVDNHQSELVALHDVHAQKMLAIKRKHKEEVSMLQQDLANVHKQAQSNAACPASPGISDLKQSAHLEDKIQHLENINQKLTVDLELTHAADREKARRLQQIQEQLHTQEEKNQELCSEISSLKQERSDLMLQLDSVVSDKRRMSGYVNDISEKLRITEQELKTHREEDAQHVGTSISRDTALPSDADHSRCSSHEKSGHPSDNVELSLRNQELDTKVKTLQAEISSYQSEISLFELVKSDWQMEKEALEDVLLRLREQLREKEEALNSDPTPKDELQKQLTVETTMSQSDVSVIAATENDQIKAFQEELVSREKQIKDITEELEQRDHDITDIQTHVERLTSSLTDKDSCLKDLQQKLTDKEDELSELIQEQADKKDLQVQMDGLWDRLKTEKKDKSSLRVELDEKKIELDNVNVGNNDLMLLKQQLNLKLEETAVELESSKKFSDKLQQEKDDVIEERDGLLSNLQELDTQHEMAMAQIIQFRDEAVKENNILKTQLAEIETRAASDNITGPSSKIINQSAEQIQEKIQEVQSQQENVAMIVNDLHVDNHDVTENNRGHVGDARTATNAPHIELECIKQQLAAQIAENQKQELTIHSLQEKLDQLLTAENLREQAKSTGNLECDLEAHKTLENNMNQLQISHKAQIAQLQTSHDAHKAQLEANINSLQQEKHTLGISFHENEGKYMTLAAEFEQFRKERSEPINMNIDGFHNRNRKVDSHQTEVGIQVDLSPVQEIPNKILDGQKHRLEYKIKETVEDDLVSVQPADNSFVLKKFTAELKILPTIEVQYKQMLQHNKQVRTKVEHFKSVVRELKTKDNSEQIEFKIIDDLSSVEQQIFSLSKALDEKESRLSDYLCEIETLQKNINSSELCEKTTQTNETCKNMSNGQAISIKLEPEDSEFEKLDQISGKQSNRKRLKEDTAPLENCVIQKCDINNANDHSMTDVKEELNKLREQISQKDKVISQLNDNNTSLLKLLEERSQAIHGDTSLVDKYHLQKEVSRLQMEKDQIMSVLNEKTRECSALKTEVHHLMNVVSAEKLALSKLQQDNQELMLTKDTSNHIPNQDMTQETVKRLSQIIRDKDFEIESLNQKNVTLLHVLQESSQEAPQISALVQEKDNLMRQVAMFQQEREQLIAALSAKHQESLAYHSELQRLSQVLHTETHKHEGLHNEFSGLKLQYEDKKQALVKMQNEMLNYKRKFLEAENRFREIQKTKDLTQAKLTDLDKDTPNKSLVDLPEKNLSSELPNSSGPHTEDTKGQSSDLVVPCTACQCAQQLEDLQSVIRSNEETFVEHHRHLKQKDTALCNKDKCISEKDTMINEKDKLLSEIHSKLSRTDEILRIRETELSSIKKQTDNVTFQLHGIQTECSDLRQERDQLHERNSILQQEMNTLKDANNHMTVLMSDKAFEISTLKEKCQTLNTLMQQKGEGEKGEVDKMLKETEVIQKQCQQLKQERDQTLLALQQQQSESQQLHQEIERLTEKQRKLIQELDRLRGHLLTIEETYTQEALASEEREKDLRNRLTAAEEKALSSSTAIQMANQQAMQQLENLQSQLHIVTEQRDNTLIQLSSAQETANQYATSLTNLQMVLEQFQMERETQQNADIECYQKQVDAYKKEVFKLAEQVRQLQVEADNTSDALEAAQRLSEQLDRKEEMIAALRVEVQLRESQLNKAEEDIHKLSNSTEAKVDKVLMRNLILGYFHTPKTQQAEALKLIGRMLDFSQADISQLGTQATTSWFGSIFKKAAPTPPSTPKAGSPNKSFSELFVNFLEQESTPKPNLHLPTDRMVKESQQRYPHSHQSSSLPDNHSVAAVNRQLTFNPFSAPMHATMPLHVSTEQDGMHGPSHPLMKAIPTSLPMFAPARNTKLVAPSTEPETFLSAVPAGSGAILRDVLQQ